MQTKFFVLKSCYICGDGMFRHIRMHNAEWSDVPFFGGGAFASFHPALGYVVGLWRFRLFAFVAVGPACAYFGFLLGGSRTVLTGDVALFLGFGLHFVIFGSGAQSCSFEHDAAGDGLCDFFFACFAHGDGACEE